MQITAPQKMELPIDATWVALLGAMAIVIFALAAKRKKIPFLDTDGKDRDWVMGVSGLGAIFLLIIAGGLATWGSWAQSSGTPSTPATVTPPASGTGYTQGYSPSVSVAGVQVAKTGTAIPVGTALAYKATGMSAFAAGAYGTPITTVARGVNVEMYAGSNQSGSYYAVKKAVVVANEQPQTVSADLAAKATPGNVQSYYVNDQGTANTALTIGAGQTRSGKLSLTGEYQKSVGNADCGANSNVVVFWVNDSQAQNFIYNGQSTIACPKIISNSAVAHIVAKCFAAPVLLSDSSTGEKIFTFQADAANDPGTDVTWDLYDSNWYVNTVTGNYECGICDDTGADVGITGVVSGTIAIS
jgi:hypothetical protein